MFHISNGEVVPIQSSTDCEQIYDVDGLNTLLASIVNSVRVATKPEKMCSIPANESGKRALEVAMIQGHTITFYANEGLDNITYLFMRVAIQNGVSSQVYAACPCGKYKSDFETCFCSSEDFVEYNRNKIATDMYTDILRPRIEAKQDSRWNEPHDTVLARVEYARRNLENVSYSLDDTCDRLMRSATVQMHLTDDDYDCVIEVARSIAAIYGSPCIQPAHLAESLMYRQKPAYRYANSH